MAPQLTNRSGKRKAKSLWHGALPVDKEAGVTSHDVVSICRRVFQTRRVGHAGTLDPPATGVLVVLIGEATKLAAQLTKTTKVYETWVRFGTETSTLDQEGEVVRTGKVPPLDEELVVRATRLFVGGYDQQVPKVSAVKVGGERLYRLAKEGKEVVLPSRFVDLHEATLLELAASEARFRLTTGPGFYVRAFARDLSAALGTLGHVDGLRRTRVASFDEKCCISTEKLREQASDRIATSVQQPPQPFVPLAELAKNFKRLVLNDEGVEHARQGRLVPPTTVLREWDAPTQKAADAVALVDSAEQPVALGQLCENGVRVTRGFRFS